MQSSNRIDIVVSSCDATSLNSQQNSSQKSANGTLSNSKPHASNSNSLIFSSPAHINSLTSIHKTTTVFLQILSKGF